MDSRGIQRSARGSLVRRRGGIAGGQLDTAPGWGGSPPGERRARMRGYMGLAARGTIRRAAMHLRRVAADTVGRPGSAGPAHTPAISAACPRRACQLADL